MREFLTPEQLRSLVITDGWDKEFVESLIASETPPPAASSDVDAGLIRLSRSETHVIETARYRLARHPQMQAEAIARHYMANAASAQHLLKIIEMARYTESSPDVESAIKYLTDQIRTNHRHDFGIELSWPNAEVGGHPRPEAS